MRRRLVAGCEEGVGLGDERRVTMSAASCPIAIASFRSAVPNLIITESVSPYTTTASCSFPFAVE